MRNKQEVSDTVIEKVTLTENLLLCFSTGVEPEPEELERARELGVDVEGLANVKGVDNASTY